MSTIPAWLKNWIKPNTLWHQEVHGWLCQIDPGSEKYPFVYNVQKTDEGYGGPAQSFDEAMENIKTLLKRKGLTLPRRHPHLPGMEP